jgi:hypothetical protein
MNTYGIPDTIMIESEHFGAQYASEGRLVGKVLTIFRDSTGDQYAAFEMADMAGVHLIHLGSRFFVMLGTDETTEAMDEEMRDKIKRRQT